MQKEKIIKVILWEQNVINRVHSVDIQYFNNLLFFDLIRITIMTST